MQTTTRRRLCCEKLGTTHMLKALPFFAIGDIGSSLEHIHVVRKEQMMTSVRKTLKTLVWSAQNRSISSEIICLQNNHKIGRFLPIAFWWSLPRKLPWNWSFLFANLSLKIPRNWTFSSATYQKPCFGHFLVKNKFYIESFHYKVISYNFLLIFS